MELSLNDLKRPMTAKRFSGLKLSAKKTSEGYLSAYRNFLDKQGYLDPLLEAYDRGEILPTPTFQSIQQLLMASLIEAEVKKAQETIAKNIEDFQKKPKDANGNIVSGIPSGNYLISLMVKKYDDSGELVGTELGTIESWHLREVENEKGELVEEKYKVERPAIFSEDLYSKAQSKADRELFKREDSVFAVIENTGGEKRIETRVHRDDSIARLFPKVKQAVCKSKPKSTNKLGFTGKAKQSRSIGPNW